MANKRDLKKDINYVLGDIIEAVYLWQAHNPEADKKASEEIITDAINTFDSLMVRVNERKVENYSAHFKAVREDLEKNAIELIEKVNSL
ncbi:hypothetical protein ACJRPK_14905 [Aquimarina sp. 2-A2]|uniref:hypothetical protein n=1 Tax=Aquimarina sp. 2-A2 TaxID=3382644 RepID=UPI00387F021C